MECSVIGYGNFSRASCVYLKDYFKLFVYDVNEEIIVPDYIEKVDIKKALQKDIILLSLPVQYIESFLQSYSKYFRVGSIVLDICSVKMKPVDLMKKYLPEGVRFVGTHPLFGPQSIKTGIKNHKIVLSSENEDRQLYDIVKKFLLEKLSLKVIEMTSESHDREMAIVQGLNHFIVKGLSKMKLEKFDVSTPAYDRLYSLYDNLRHDSNDLFYTIQRENPFADEVRKKFINILNEIEGDILNEE